MFQEDDAPTALASLVLGGIVGASLALILMPRESDTRHVPTDPAGRLARHGRRILDELATRAARERVPEPGLSSTSPTFLSQV